MSNSYFLGTSCKGKTEKEKCKFPFLYKKKKYSKCTKDVLADEAGLMIEEDTGPNEPTGDSNRMSCKHSLWTVNDLPGKDPLWGLFSFCGDISPRKTPQISIYSF